jgi:hypothetical protein
MMNENWKEGERVIYKPNNEKGRIKTMHPTGTKAWVVYRCAGDWERFRDYTGALTLLGDLKQGWSDD